MTTLKQGDLIHTGNGFTRKVMEVLGTILHISRCDDHNKYSFTTDEATLKENNYTWDTPAWEPEMNTPYWFILINEGPFVRSSVWNNDGTDHDRRNFLGIFETKELAKAALLEIRRKLGK